MKILSIETSCDETAISLVEVIEGPKGPAFNVLGSSIASQIELHRQWGGVVPNLARREHKQALIPVLDTVLTQAGMRTTTPLELTLELIQELKNILEREDGLADNLVTYLQTIPIPDIDVIAVTTGPGLAPALWVGINFAKALSLAWHKKLIPINHMEGHIMSPLVEHSSDINFPALALLISGGHTELVSIKAWGEYEKIGQTRDDAVGEAFDKVARLLDLPYPGGPEISRLAETAETKNLDSKWDLPRPMLNSPDLDFSFSGLKTAVRYAITEKTLTSEDKQSLALEFEQAVAEVLVEKTRKAIEQTGSQTLIIGGGVIANKRLRKAFQKLVDEFNIPLLLPTKDTTTDNATMIAIAGYFHQDQTQTNITAEGNLSF